MYKLEQLITLILHIRTYLKQQHQIKLKNTIYYITLITLTITITLQTTLAILLLTMPSARSHSIVSSSILVAFPPSQWDGHIHHHGISIYMYVYRCIYRCMCMYSVECLAYVKCLYVRYRIVKYSHIGV